MTPMPIRAHSSEVLERVASTSTRHKTRAAIGVSRRRSSAASQAAAAVAPATMAMPIWFFSYQTPRHIPSLTPWCTPIDGTAKTMKRLSTPSTSAQQAISRGRFIPWNRAPR
ncbi:hypothetical protein D3C80_1381200 [compost metagenome]